MTRPPLHPGEILAEEVEFPDMTASALARELDVQVSRVTQILRCC